MNNITITTRELWSLTITAAVVSFIVGVVLFALIASLFILPARDAESTQRVKSAYAKGAMLKISASKARCDSWKLKNGKAVCE